MSKPVLYIIHGWTYTTTPWQKTLAILRKNGIKVIMLNVPGLTSPSKKVWTIEEYMNWADRHIPDGATALGHSNGGRILLNLCANKPNKLKHLILLDSAGVYEQSLKRDVSRFVSKRLGFLKQVPGLAKVWHKLTGASDYAKAPENMKQTLSNMLDSDKSLDIGKVRVPTSILWGGADKVTPPHQAEIMHEKILDSTLKIVPKWTHAPYIADPEGLAKVILSTMKNPPKQKPVDTVAGSASLALKKAPKSTLAPKGETNDVVADVPTKLVLRKVSELTKGIKATEEEGAAVKYEPKKREVATKKTDASEVSASKGFRKAKTVVKPDTDAAAKSASATFKKAAGNVQGDDVAGGSASLAFKKPATSGSSSEGLLQELASNGVELELEQPVEPMIISSASVKKVSRLKKAKRLVDKENRPSKKRKVAKKA